MIKPNTYRTEQSSSLMRIERVQLLCLRGIPRIAGRAHLHLEVRKVQPVSILVARPHGHLGLESGLLKGIKRLLVLSVVLGVGNSGLLEWKDSSLVSGC